MNLINLMYLINIEIDYTTYVYIYLNSYFKVQA